MTVLAEKSNQGSAHVLNSIWSVVQERGLKVGDQLPSIRELSDRLEVKRTTVRDALLKAESLGIVKVMPRAGAFLQTAVPNSSEMPLDSTLPHAFHQALHRDEHNLFHLLDSRRLIEVELAGRAAEHRRLEDLLPVRRAWKLCCDSHSTHPARTMSTVTFAFISKLRGSPATRFCSRFSRR